MEQEIIRWLSSDNGLVVHIAIFTILVLGGVGFPIPEDVPIILAGVAAGRGIVSMARIWVTCYVGVLVADLLVYGIGFFFGPKLLDAGNRSRFLPTVSPAKMNEIRDGLRKRRLVIIFASRHLFPIRSVTFLTAGALRIPFIEFLLADAFAALVSVSLVFYLGFRLGEHLPPEVISHFLQRAHIYLIGLLVVFLGIYLIRKRMQARKAAQLPAADKLTAEPVWPADRKQNP